MRRAFAVAFVLAAALLPAPGRAQTCVSPALAYAAPSEPAITPPLTIVYPPSGNASVAGQGSNPSAVGYSVTVTQLSPGSYVDFGVNDSDTNEGVPWDDASGTVTDGHVKAWALDVGTSAGTPSYKVTITLDSPVTGLKFGVTDLDINPETVLVQAFPVSSGGSVIPLLDHLLSNPPTIPALASGVPHATDDAYVVDQTKVGASGGGLYTVLSSGNIHDQTGTVLFAYGDAESVQRVEITYTGRSTGIWIAGLVFDCTAGGPAAALPVPAVSTAGLAALALAMAAAGWAFLRKYA